MGVVSDLVGAFSDSSFSSASAKTPPSGMIPFPDLSKVASEKHRRKIIEKWIDRNTAIATMNNLDRVFEAMAYLGLFLGQIGIYSPLDTMQRGFTFWEVWEGGKIVETLTEEQMAARVASGIPKPPGQHYRQQVGTAPDWQKILATSGIITGLSYMMKDNTAAAVYPIGGIMSVLALDQLDNIFSKAL